MVDQSTVAIDMDSVHAFAKAHGLGPSEPLEGASDGLELDETTSRYGKEPQRGASASQSRAGAASAGAGSRFPATSAQPTGSHASAPVNKGSTMLMSDVDVPRFSNPAAAQNTTAQPESKARGKGLYWAALILIVLVVVVGSALAGLLIRAYLHTALLIP